MRTEKLYEKDAYQVSFTATVLSCVPAEKGYAVILDKTAFFPEQGGQYADKGSLNGQNVTDVQIENDEIVHYVDSPLAEGEQVAGTIDRDTRFIRMQTHTGEHILSGVIHNLYGHDNVGFHLGDGYATVDTSGPLTKEQIARAEEEANRIVWDDRKVYATYPSFEELKSICYRSKIDPREGIRLVHIDGCDVCACYAPHLSSTGQVGLIKVVAAEPRKKGTRLTVLCGSDAYENFVRTQNLMQEAQRMLSATPDTLLTEIKRTLDRLAEKEKECKALKVKCALSSLVFTSGNNIEYAFVEGADFDVLRAVAPSVTTENIRALFSENDGLISYVVFSSAVDVRPFVKDLNAAFNGKGGGSPAFAQGKLTTSVSDLTAFLSL